MARTTNRRRRTVAAGLAALQAEAGGVYELVIISQQDSPLLIAAASRGDPRAQAYAAAITAALRYTAGRRPLCLLCATRFSAATTPAAFCLLYALGAAPDGGMTLLAHGLCAECNRSDNLQDRVVAYLRANLFDGAMRVLPPLAAGSMTRQ